MAINVCDVLMIRIIRKGMQVCHSAALVGKHDDQLVARAMTDEREELKKPSATSINLESIPDSYCRYAF